MDPIAEIRNRLSRYPDAKFVETSASIEVSPRDESGFTVGLLAGGGRFTVNFAGWHEEFDSADAAVNCFAFGLSAACRLHVTYRGRMPTSWSVQSHVDGEWTTDSTTGLLLVPFWLRKRDIYLQNRLIAST
jgi:hypothetical protein